MSQAAFRAAAVDLLTDFAAQLVGTPPDEVKRAKLQVYPGRPRTVAPPTAFVDAIGERIEYTGPQMHQRTITADVLLIHGSFDSAEAASQKDAFVDDFLAYVVPRYHEAGANTLIAVTETEDLPTYVPDWLPPAEQRTYYATRIVLEGYAEDVATP